MKAIYKDKKINFKISKEFILKKGIKYSYDWHRYLWQPKKNDYFYFPDDKILYKYLKWNDISPSGRMSTDGFALIKNLNNLKENIFWINNMEVRNCIPLQKIKFKKEEK